MRRWGTEDVGLEEAYGRRVIGQGVRRSRLQLGWSQIQLGWRVGLHQSTVSRLESGHLRTMRMVTLARIIGALRMTSLELFPHEPDAPTKATDLGRDAPPSPRRRLPGQEAA